MKLEHVRNFTEIRDVHPGKLSITEPIKTACADKARDRSSLRAALLL